MSLARNVDRVYRGEITFDAFCRASQKDWERMARYLMSRWLVPQGVERSDIEQELKIGAWRALGTWDESGMTLSKYVVWSALNAAKKWMHKQRNALRRDDRSLGRFPLTETQARRLDRPERSRPGYQEEPLEVPIDPKQEDVILLCDNFAMLLAQVDDPLDQQCLVALAKEGDVDGAARVIYSDPRVRLSFRLAGEESARRLVREAVDRALAL